MDSDIDIHEHNVFENPDLRILFPDITALKQEIYGENIQDFNIEDSEPLQVTCESLSGTIGGTQIKNACEQSTQKQSKVTPKSLLPFSPKEQGLSKSTHHNCIKYEILKVVKIILSDVKPVLAKSKRFCKVCLILFPKDVNLTNHRNAVHGEKYICYICGNNFYQMGNLNRHLKEIHKLRPTARKSNGYLKSNIQPDPATELTKDTNVVQMEACFHCSKRFRSKALLIEHLYSVLEPKLNSRTKIPHESQGSSKSRTHLDKNADEECLLHYEQPVSSEVNNDLYYCKICLAQILSYDEVIEHCQDHIINNRNSINNIHQRTLDDVYSQDRINGKRVYHFEPYYYGSSNDIWLKHIFPGLSSCEVDKKLLHSIYRFENRIKLEICRKGSSHHTEYKCMKCQCFVESSMLFSHANECDPPELEKHSCAACKNVYISKATLSRHLQLHERIADMQNVTIVVFNQDSDRRINELIKLNPSRPHYVLYRCRSCEGLVDKREFPHHVCSSEDLQRCHQCGLLLRSGDYETHASKHKHWNSFVGSNMKVVLLGDSVPEFNRSTSVTSSFLGIVCDYSFHECTRCGVCIRDSRCIPKHFCFVEAAKATCALCELCFERGKLKAHMRLHSEDPEFVKSNIITMPFTPKQKEIHKARKRKLTSVKTEIVHIREQDVCHDDDQLVLFRCIKCGLHYLSKSEASEHVKKSPARVKKQDCTKCGLPFPPDALYAHLKRHHTRPIDTIHVVDVCGVFKKRSVFKCGKCKSHFTNARKTREHYLECVGESGQGEKCQCCGLTFHHSHLLSHENSSEYNMHTDCEVIDVGEEFISNDSL